MERVARRAQVGPGVLPDVLEAGIAAGVLAGLGMAAWLWVFGVFTGLGGFTALRLIGGTLYRQSALEGGFGPAFWGLVLHLVIAALFGALYGLVTLRFRPEPFAEVAGAVVYGLVVWLVMTFAVMPVVDPRVSGFSTAWFGAHVVYGAILGILPQLRRRDR